LVLSGMVLGNRADIEEVNTPSLLDMGFSPVCIVRIRVRVPSQPHLNGPLMRVEIIFEGLRIWFAVNPVEIGRSLRCALFKVTVITISPFSIFIFHHSLPFPGSDSCILENVMMHRDND